MHISFQLILGSPFILFGYLFRVFQICWKTGRELANW
jgi:hypothetical protein